ncbi:MAG: aspartate aminotransferase family protein [Nitrososphaerota archaeon]|nr:aspartate aminotransferase family protein [Candidatus Calditenuaceae archaeon]MDW8073559.1 aspartate aminotransferase family protein [Nitrososphaerota archaeon]
MASLLKFSTPRGLKVSRAEGQYVWDSSGRRYIDFHTGHGAAFLGHRNRYVVARLRSQLEYVTCLPPFFDSEILEEALKSLGRILPSHLGHVFFMNSGSEAVELALKLARKRSRRKVYAAFTGAFHGRTMAALSVTHNPKYRQGYDPFPSNTIFLPFNNVEALRTLDERVAAVIVEPVQGEGGIHIASREFLRAVEERCREVGAYFIVDEVQTGFGRTGLVWSHLEYGVRPDILVAGKSIGGGFPVSFVAVSDDVASKVEEGEHGSTHGGNPLALAAVVGGVEALERERVPEAAGRMGGLLASRLKEVAAEAEDVVREVRSKGLMAGVELKSRAAPLVSSLQERCVLALRAGLIVLRFLPPYLITERDVEEAVTVLREALAKFRPGVG